MRSNIHRRSRLIREPNENLVPFNSVESLIIGGIKGLEFWVIWKARPWLCQGLELLDLAFSSFATAVNGIQKYHYLEPTARVTDVWTCHQTDAFESLNKPTNVFRSLPFQGSQAELCLRAKHAQHDPHHVRAFAACGHTAAVWCASVASAIGIAFETCPFLCTLRLSRNFEGHGEIHRISGHDGSCSDIIWHHFYIQCWTLLQLLRYDRKGLGPRLSSETWYVFGSKTRCVSPAELESWATYVQHRHPWCQTIVLLCTQEACYSASSTCCAGAQRFSSEKWPEPRRAQTGRSLKDLEQACFLSRWRAATLCLAQYKTRWTRRRHRVEVTATLSEILCL